jgi:glycerate dehydrogenase
MAMTAVILDYSTMGPDLDLAPLTELLPDLEVFDATPDELVTERIGNAEFVFVNKIRLTRERLQAAANLRFIGLTATGTDNVDLDIARRHGVAVCNIRGYCSRSVTEHVFGVLLMLTHNLHRYDALARSGAWQKASDFCMLDFPVRELSSMTLGIVGYGELGRSVAATARHFGMDVIVAARPGTDHVPGGRVALPDLLRRCDVITLHCPLNADTRHLLGRNEFEAMKTSAILINTARGGLVDSAALVDALDRGEIGAAAIDVLAEEPPVNGDPLLAYDGNNLIVTPHIAWSTDLARQNAIDELAENVRSFLDGGDRNRVV